jgi:colanic acid/amylovoran/stewartan biosynthesis glycosyltransferase WcaL/AmsK/CpsK
VRVAFIVNQFPLLSETFILNQITGLIDRGCKVDIYAHKIGSELRVHPDVPGYNLLPSTYCLACVGPDSLIRKLSISARHFSASFKRNSRVALKSINAFRLGKVAASPTWLYRSQLFLNNGPYDIVHCQFGPNGNLGVQLREAGALSGSLVAQFRGYDISSYVQLRGRAIYDQLFRKADLILCVSESIRAKLLELGCPEQKICVHHSGVDTRQFALPKRQAARDSKVKVLTIARLVEKKGVRYGIQAVADAAKTHPCLEYRIVGDGQLRGELQQLIEQLGAGLRIQLLGWKRQDEVVRLFEESDILLAPSVTGGNGDEEGIPNVLMEALARGLPVLSTYHGGIPELIQDGKSGFLVPERDVKALAEKLEVLIDNRDLWPVMGEAGRRFVEEHFNIDKLNDRLLKIYKSLQNQAAVPWECIEPC